MPVIDTHCHLDIVASQGISIADSLKNAAAADVQAVVQIATGFKSSEFNKNLAINYAASESGLPRLFWTAGLHPESVNESTEADTVLDFIKDNLDSENFIGIGETGLDYYHSTEYREQQKISFLKHLRLASELNLPVVTHLRDGREYIKGNSQAVVDAQVMMKEFKNLRGVLHCFTYGYDEAMPFVDRGWYVSYSGIVTYKNARIVQDGAARLPLECLLVETDAPFLSPVPHRGSVNEPARVVHTLEYIVQLRQRERGEDPEQIRRQILENSIKFINKKLS